MGQPCECRKIVGAGSFMLRHGGAVLHARKMCVDHKSSLSLGSKRPIRLVAIAVSRSSLTVAIPLTAGCRGKALELLLLKPPLTQVLR